ncbi:MAG: FRG domain-containing protein [Bacteroidales bacterium]|jgi:hypothetical protein|nr:FRG domain-containing protein [Bacteroidales bacterium]
MLDYYTDFKDKESKVLGKKRVIHINDIDEIFDQFKKNYYGINNKWIFRGVNQAAYKMFTSSQRLWNTNKDNKEYSEYLALQIDSIEKWNNGILKNYLASINSEYEDNNLAYFSIMQHYGLGTPLLDFTHNPLKSLYFACKGVAYCYFDNDLDDIKNYFSVYFIDPKYFEFKDLTKKVNDIDLENLAYGTFLIENDKIVNNNLNIIAQEGLFIVNTFPDKDLIESLNFQRGEENEKLFGCYNIHKSLAKPLKIKLEEKGISDQLLFPDLNELKL